MSEQNVFHLGVNKSQLEGATLAILPGDPGRVPKIANLLEAPKAVANNREYNLYLGKLEGQAVVVCSTGIGGPSTSIAVEELAQLGVRTFLRIGTTGAIQPEVEVGDIIVTTGAVRLDGASGHFAPMEYPAVANFEVATAMKAAAEKLGAKVHMGITASSDTFYPGQERYDTYSGRVVRHLQGSLAQWQQLGVLNFEMESATLFTMCSTAGLKAGCVSGVIVNRTQNEIPDHSVHAQTEARAIRAVVDAAALLLKTA